MYDIVKGPVLKVVDGDTFDINVTHIGTNNKFKYGNTERIRIVAINAPELNTPAGLRAKTNLQARLRGKVVKCDVHSRDTFGRLVGNVEIV